MIINYSNEEKYIKPKSILALDTKNADCQSIINLINIYLGDNIVGAEIGVHKGTSFCTFLQECPSIKILYGIDNYKPYADFLGSNDVNKPCYIVDEVDAKVHRNIAYHNIKYSGYADKVIFLEKDSKEALNDIPNESLDFIFIDTYLTLEQAKNDINDWYKKVKPKGLFSGHDFNTLEVQIALKEFCIDKGIQNNISIFDNCWVMIK